MKVLVTGATGFIGRRLVAALVGGGHEVTALVRKTSDKDVLPGGTSLVEGDMLDESSLDRAVKGKDAVIHLAAYFDLYPKDVSLLYRVNVGGTRSLLDACARGGVKRFLYCSTTEVIGPVKDPPADEETELRPCFDYSKSKVMGERIVREATKKMGIDHVIIRPTGVIGDDDTYMGFQILKALNDHAIPVIPGDGSKIFMLTHVDDIVRGFLAALTSKSATNNTFILCPDAPMSYKQVLELAADYLGAKPPRIKIPALAAKVAIGLLGLFKNREGKRTFLWHAQSIQLMVENHSYTNKKAREILGWSPKMSMQESIKKAANSHIAEGRLVRNKKGSLINLFLG